MQWRLQTRCARGSADHRINANRQSLALYSLSKSSKISKILHFLSKPGVMEIFCTSVTNADLETFPDMAQKRCFHIAEIFVLGRMYR
jgi:hypothetical protein